jgi:CRP/FNR family transcriptional regulator, cyclic AMP receptor protein
MRTTDEKIELLRQLPTFQGAGRRELRSLAAAADVATVEAGRVLCRADRRALESYVIVDGMVDVVIDGATVATLRRGQIVGELGIIDGEPRSADVVAATDATVLAISAAATRALIETSHTFRTALLRQLADRVRSLDLDLALRPVAAV